MFERFTQTARRVIFAARYIAGRVGSKEIDTEHVLLGSVSTDKSLARRFFGSPWAAEDIWTGIEQRKPVREKVAGPVELPLSSSSKRVLRFAAEEANLISDRNIRTAHLLLGLLREDTGLAAEILRERGIRLIEVRRELQANPHDDLTTEKFVREIGSRPEKITELQARIQAIRSRIEEAISHGDFAAAKVYSDEEGKVSDELFSLYRQHGLLDWIYS